MAGVALAAGVVEHQYFLTEKKLDLPKTLPTLRDPDKNFYLKPDVGAFAIGGWEKGTKGCWRSRPPFEFGRELFPENMDRLELFALPCAERLPVLNEIGIQTVINGPIPVSADGEPILGLAPELDNFFVACGFTAGIAASGGAGEAMANWILDGDPGMDLWAFDVRRFGRPHSSGQYLEERAIEAYGDYYSIHWPGAENEAGRGLRRSPVHEHLKAEGAIFGARFGWERPLWFADPGVDRKEISSFEGKPSWFDHVGREHRQIRESVALIDQTSFSKFTIEGPGATAFLESICTQPHRGRAGALHLHDDAQRARRRRGRGDAASSRAGQIRHDQWVGVRRARFELGAPASAEGQPDRSDGRDLWLGRPQYLRSQVARGPAIRFGRRSL